MGTDLQHISENFRQLQVDAHCPVPHLLFLPCLGTSNLLQFSWINWLSEHMHHLQPYKKNLHNNLHIRRSPSSARSCISGLVRAKHFFTRSFASFHAAAGQNHHSSKSNAWRKAEGRVARMRRAREEGRHPPPGPRRPRSSAPGAVGWGLR